MEGIMEDPPVMKVNHNAAIPGPSKVFTVGDVVQGAAVFKWPNRLTAAVKVPWKQISRLYILRKRKCSGSALT